MAVKQCILCSHIFDDFDSISEDNESNSKVIYCNECFINTVYID